MDVISASQNDDKVAWYRNLILGVDASAMSRIRIYPNPTSGYLFIEVPTGSISQIRMYDVLGKNVLQIDGNKNEVAISHLQNGMYFLKTSTENGNAVHRLIKE